MLLIEPAWGLMALPSWLIYESGCSRQYGQWTIVSGKEPLNNAMTQFFEERYQMARDAFISSGQLFHDLVQLTNNEAA